MSTNRDQMDNDSRSSLHNSRGIDLAERGWLDEAINEFKNAIKSAPNSAQGYDNLATAYADKGELLCALSSYTKALSLEPDNPVALHNLGCFLSNHGNQLAAKCFKNAFTLEPDLYEARFNLGLCLAAEDKHEQALFQFEAALSQNYHDQDARFQLALSLIALGKHNKAIKELLTVVKANKQNDQAWFFLGGSFEELGFLEEATNAYSSCVTINAHHLDAILALASILQRLDRSQESRAFVKRALKLDAKRSKEFIAQDEYLCHEPRFKNPS